VAVGSGRVSLPVRSVWLVFAKGVQMGGGFLFWIVAARSASVPDVGLAVATVSAVMLCTQLGILGVGSAAIIALGGGRPVRQVLDSSFSVVVAGSLVGGAGYLAVARLGGSPAAGSGAVYLLLFLVAAAAGTCVICLDQISIALHHTEGATLRYGVGSVLSLTAVSVLALAPGRADPLELVAAWTLGAVGSVLVGLFQLRRWAGYRFRPSLSARPAWLLVRTGVPNQLLTLTERLSPVLVPLILAHVVSPTQAAYWYPAWMMVWAAFTAPISVGMVQFADIVRRPEDTARIVWVGLKWSLLLGGALCAVLVAGAEPLLGLLGGAYADASAGALRVLTLGLVPFVVLQAYNAYCRATARTREATLVGLCLLTAVSAGTATMGERGPLAVAVVWVAATTLASVFAGTRLLAVVRSSNVGAHSRSRSGGRDRG
jgi:O-antigen/teichoic acid export membrane protein